MFIYGLGYCSNKLYKILKFLNKRNNLYALEIYGNYIYTSVTSLNKVYNMILKLNNLEAVGIQYMSTDIAHYYSMLFFNQHTSVKTLYLAPIIYNIIFRDPLLNMRFYNTLSIKHLIDNNYISQKSVNIYLPLEDDLYPQLFNIFPNIKGIGIYSIYSDLSFTSYLIKLIHNIFLQHPNVNIKLYSNKPSKRTLNLLNEYPDRLLIEHYES